MKLLKRFFKHDEAWIMMAVLCTAIAMLAGCAPYQGNEWLLEMQAEECAISPLC